MSYIIEDWTSQRVGTDTFDSFDDARDAISELATIEANNNYSEDLEFDKWTELYDGICEDLYAVETKEV